MRPLWAKSQCLRVRSELTEQMLFDYMPNFMPLMVFLWPLNVSMRSQLRVSHNLIWQSSEAVARTFWLEWRERLRISLR